MKPIIMDGRASYNFDKAIIIDASEMTLDEAIASARERKDGSIVVDIDAREVLWTPEMDKAKEQHECEWGVLKMGMALCIVGDKRCQEVLRSDEIERRLNEYETLKEKAEALLHAVARSPVYHKVKDTYTELRDILEGK